MAQQRARVRGRRPRGDATLLRQPILEYVNLFPVHLVLLCGLVTAGSCAQHPGSLAVSIRAKVLDAVRGGPDRIAALLRVGPHAVRLPTRPYQMPSRDIGGGRR